MDVLYEGRGFWPLFHFLLLTVALGGAAALASGRAVASTWRPFAQVALYALPLALAVRFLHYALFEETLLSLHFFLVAYVLLFGLATFGYRRTRAAQMARQYSFAFRRDGLFGWRRA